MTHRVFSRNAMSSRAIPVAKMLEQVRTRPASTTHWGKNQPGMQAGEEVSEETKKYAKGVWLEAAADAARHAESLMNAGVHKQVANRLLEPFQWMQTIVTSSTFENWNNLRDHQDAEPNIKALAQAMNKARASSVPHVSQGSTAPGDCHLPYITVDEKLTHDTLTLMKMSAARCARVSYLTHDGAKPDVNKDLALFDRLVGSQPIHASPTEHQALTHRLGYSNSNFDLNWLQFRKIVEMAHNESIPLDIAFPRNDNGS